MILVNNVWSLLIILYMGKISPRFIFALWFEGEFKTGPVELYIKDYVRKLDGGQIQDWANQC